MKKSTITALIAAGLLCTTLTACTTNNNETIDRSPLVSTITSQPDKSHFKFIERARTNDIKAADGSVVYATLTSEEASFVAESRADRPSSLNMNTALTRAYERSQNIYDSFSTNLKTYFSQENPDMSVFPWEAKVDFTCVRNDGRAISVIENIDYYSAGVVTGSTIITYNFDPSTGEQINQPFYILNDKESFDTSDDVMYKKLLAKYGEEVIDYKNVSSSFVEVAASCWYFTDDGVKVTFGPGTIAPEDTGILELEYTKEELCEFAHKYFA